MFQGTERFRIVRRLGEGGMGVVYEAVDRSSGRRLALKQLRRLTPDGLLRFKTEFRSLQGLQHDNLVALHELFEDGGHWFFTMDLIRGSDFTSYVRPQATPGSGAPGADDADTLDLRGSDDASRWFHEDRLRDALRQLVDAVAALHDAGKIHRDIKPSNVLVDRDGRLRVLDFGLVADRERSSAHSTEGHVVGTAAYMSPEQAASKPLTAAADWYSVGVMLYECLCGRLPFVGKALEVLMEKQRGDPPPPASFDRSVPADLEAMCMALLRFDPNQRPGPDELRARLGGETPAARSWPAGSTHTGAVRFVGRAIELGVLRSAMAEVEGGVGATVFVTGGSGVGKSALVRQFTAELDGSVAVLTGACYERETVPYKAFDGLIDALSRYLRRLPAASVAPLIPRYASLLPRVFPTLGRVRAIADAPEPGRVPESPVQLRRRVFETLRELLARMAENEVVVLVLEDFQWADLDSLRLLEELTRPPDPPSLLLLVTCRADRATLRGGVPDARPLSLEGRVVDLELTELHAREAHRLARLLLRRAGADEAISPSLIAMSARGHPLYIDELVRHAVGSGQTEVAPDLDDAIWKRVQALDAAAQRVLALIATAGRPVAADVMRSATEMRRAEFERVDGLLRAASLVRGRTDEHGAVVEAFHDRVRETVRLRLDAATQRALHRRLAAAYVAEGTAAGRPELVLHHLEASGQTRRAAAYAIEAAGRAANALAFDRAAALYGQALELGEASGDDARRLQAARAEALVCSGRAAAAAQLYLDIADGANAAERTELRRLAARHLMSTGQLERGEVVLEQLLGEFGMKPPPSPRRALMGALARGMWLRLTRRTAKPRDASSLSPESMERVEVAFTAAIGYAMLDPLRGLNYQARHLAISHRHGATSQLARALAVEAAYLSLRGARGLRRAERLVDDVDRLLSQTRPSVTGKAWSLGARSLASYMRGHYRDAQRQAMEALRLMRDHAPWMSWEQRTVELYELWTRFYLGDIRALSERVPALRREARDRGDVYMAFQMGTGLPAFVWIAADRPGEIHREAERLAAHRQIATMPLETYWAVSARANAELYAGEPERALARLGEVESLLRRGLVLRFPQVRDEWRELHVRAWIASATVANERAHLAMARSYARKLGRSRVVGARARSQLLFAGVAARRGELRRAAELAREAVRGFDAAEMKMYAAAARWRRGEIVGGSLGPELVQEARAFLDGQGIVRPDRIVALLAPGFDGDLG